MAYFEAVYRAPGDTDLYRWADWAEVICWTSSSGRLSLEEFAEFIEKRRDYLKVEGVEERDPSKGVKSDPLLESVEDVVQFNDQTVSRAVNVFYLLEARAQAYGKAYPFKVSATDNVISVANDESFAVGIYLFLLACSNFRYVRSKRTQAGLAASFETLSREAMRSMLPSASEVHIFGSSTANVGRYTGPLVDRIEHLAKDLGEMLAPQFNRTRFEAGDYGDHGLDLVAWLPWGDSLRGMPIVFAQCACTGEWVSKQFSSSYQRWVQVLTFAVPPLNSCYIPFDFRAADDTWYNEHDINSSILVDRRRFLAQLGLLSGGTPVPGLTDEFMVGIGVRDIFDAKHQDLADI